MNLDSEKTRKNSKIPLLQALRTFLWIENLDKKFNPVSISVWWISPGIGAGVSIFAWCRCYLGAGVLMKLARTKILSKAINLHDKSILRAFIPPTYLINFLFNHLLSMKRGHNRKSINFRNLSDRWSIIRRETYISPFPFPLSPGPAFVFTIGLKLIYFHFKYFITLTCLLTSLNSNTFIFNKSFFLLLFFFNQKINYSTFYAHRQVLIASDYKMYAIYTF